MIAVVKQFLPQEDVQAITPFSSGHINDTFRIDTTRQSYVLQAINTNVFPNPKAVIANKVHVSEVFKKITSAYQYITFYNTEEGVYYIETSDRFWCLMNYINGKTYELTHTPKLAYEAGKLYGNFLKTLLQEPVEKYHTIIPNFHNLENRYQQFKSAFHTATTEKQQQVAKEVQFIKAHYNELFQLNRLLDTNKLNKRIVHNDTKITNVLFDDNENGLAVIDTDTVMPGCLAFDFGDAVRTICATANEDASDLKKVGIDLSFFKQFTKGFSLHLNHVITTAEIASLSLGVKFMPFIMGVRFLTDYLNGNVYYKTTHTTHNLERARNQFQLVACILKDEKKLEQIIDKAFDSIEHEKEN